MAKWDNELFKYIYGFDTFLDIGVGYINTEAWYIKQQYPDVKIIGIEPYDLRFNQIESSFPGEIYNFAVGDTNTNDKFYFALKQNGNHLRGPHTFERPGISREINIDYYTLDSLDKYLGFGEKIFVWADIEGAELKMLKGAVELLKSGRIVGLNLELWDNRQSENWCTKEEVENFLKSYSYFPVFCWNYNSAYQHIDKVFYKA